MLNLLVFVAVLLRPHLFFLLYPFLAQAEAALHLLLALAEASQAAQQGLGHC